MKVPKSAFEDFNSLVEFYTQRIHSGLLEGGGKEMKLQVFHAMYTAIVWNARKKEIKTCD